MNRRDLLKVLTTPMALNTAGFSEVCEKTEGNEKIPVPDHPLEVGAWTMVVTQSYVKYSRNQGILELITAWIVENKAKYRIEQVLVTGDLVEQNNMGVGQYNQTSAQQWQATSRAFERLDGVIPYVICMGNHDYGIRDSENRETQVNRYFPVDRNPLWKKSLVELGENTFGEKTLENAVYEFTTPAGQKMLTLSLPFAPTDANLLWAKELLARKEYDRHFVTVLTHFFLQDGGTRPSSEGYALNQAGGNAGEGIWQKLIRCTPNI